MLPGGLIYIGELHPYKQYLGTKARFETDEGLQILDCYTHNISDFTQAAKQNGFAIREFKEFFDTGDKLKVPRVVVLVLKKG